MKKIFLALLLLVVLATFLDSCKKNPNDPLISFRTRKARVVGEWKAETGSLTFGDDINQTKYSVNGSTYTAYDDWGGSATGSAVVTYTFEKDGKFSCHINFGGFIVSREGQWNFTGGVGENKKNDVIVIHLTSEASGTNAYTFDGNDSDYTYDIEELRHKKLIIKHSDKTYFPDGTWTNYSEYMTLVPR